MARIYISSTFSDLLEARTTVYRALRKLRHDVIAMEDYIATDQRPVDKCLSDVASCDVYVGLFAWRYGYIPPQQEQSITELEFREAVHKGIPCLLFLLHDDAPWPPKQMDDDRSRIRALREECCRDLLEHAYYDGLRFMISARSSSGEDIPLVDGGAFDWLGKLTSNRKLVLVASGMGSQLAAYLFRT